MSAKIDSMKIEIQDYDSLFLTITNKIAKKDHWENKGILVFQESWVVSTAKCDQTR